MYIYSVEDVSYDLEEEITTLQLVGSWSQVSDWLRNKSYDRSKPVLFEDSSDLSKSAAKAVALEDSGQSHYRVTQWVAK